MTAKIVGKLKICPVCKGTGIVRAYGMLSGYWPSKVCKVCTGSGFAPTIDESSP